jgi:hypothetical protein
VIMTNLQAHIFTMTPTFHGTAKFMDLKRRGRRGGLVGMGVGNKGGIYEFGRDNLLCFLGIVSSGNPSQGEPLGHELMSSLRPLIKHSWKKVFDMPSVWKANCSKEMIYSSTVPNYFILVK